MVLLCNLLNIRPVCFTFSTIAFPIKHTVSFGPKGALERTMNKFLVSILHIFVKYVYNYLFDK